MHGPDQTLIIKDPRHIQTVIGNTQTPLLPERGLQHAPMSSVQAAPTKPCHNCRRQRLRCDRSYPHCNKCTKAGKECLGYGQLFRWTGAVASRGKLAGRTSSAPVSGAGNGKVEVSLHGAGPTSSSQSSLPSSPEGYDFATTPSRGSSPCPENMQIVLSRASSVEPELKSPYVLVDPLFQDLSESHRYYLSYFTTRLCKDLVSQDVPQRNPFRTLLKLTKTNPLLQYIIVAASAAHLSNLVKAPLSLQQQDPVIAFNREEASRKALRDALVAKQKALLLMHSAVQDIDSTGGDVALAAALFLVNVELIESGKHGWRPHLEGAGKIMTLLQPSSSSDSVLRDYLLSDCFIYFVLASAFMPQAFRIQSYFQESQIPHILQRAAPNSYLCCPPEVLQILYAASQLSNAPPDGNSQEDITQAGLALVEQAQSFDIQKWANDARLTPYLEDVPIESRIHAGSAHRLAGCLYILQAVPSVGEVVGKDFENSLRQQIFQHLSSIPDDDPNFKATTWPTFIAGAETVDPDRRVWVMDRLKRLVVNCPWGFLYTAMDTLQVIWELDNEGHDAKRRSWVQTLKDPSMNFLIV